MNRVSVGTKNPVKLGAVKAVLDEILSKDEVFELFGKDVDTGVDEQPRTLEETFSGAKNRARLAWDETCQYSFGLEDGLFPVPVEEGAYMNVCVCAIYDGEGFVYGTSSAFEYPQDIIDKVMDEGLDVSQALNACGYTKNAGIGSDIGAIGILSKGRLVRQDYAKQAVQVAVLRIINA